MKRLLLVSIAVILLLAGCGEADTPEQSEEIPVSVMLGETFHDAAVFFESAGNIVLPVMAEIAWGEDTFDNTAQLMVESAQTDMLLEGTGLSAVLPEGTDISAVLSENTAFVSIYSDKIPQFDEYASRASLSAVVNTFNGFPGVSFVDVKVNDTPSFGTWDTSEPMFEMIVNSERNMSGDTNIPITLYYELSENGMSVPVTRYVEKVSAEVVVSEMMQKPREHSLACMFPEGSELIGANLTQNVLTLNFSEEFSALEQDKNKETMLISALEKVVTQVPGVGSLLITVEGEPYDMPTAAVFNVVSGMRIID